MSSIEISEFSAKEVAGHRADNDAWMVINGEVYDVTKYIHDHPGGADVLLEAAGTDATEAFDNAGHSEDAFEIMAEYRVGKLKGAAKRTAPKAVRVIPQAQPKSKGQSSGVSKAVGITALTLSPLAIYCAARLAGYQGAPAIDFSRLDLLKLGRSRSQPQGFGFMEGFLVASAIFGTAGSVAAKKLMKMLHFSEGFAGYPPHMKLPKVARVDPLNQRGWLDPATFHPLPLVKKELVAPNTYLFVFELPTPKTVLGLPIGQHVSIKAEVDGKSVQRSYTPISNNSDRGVLELVIKCYPNGLLTGRYLQDLQVGDEVAFRGPKGALRYRRNMCRRVGMVAGGSGITPMYQVIRAICEDDGDTTEVRLVYANRTEDDILLRAELDAFARRYPENLKIYYMLDQPPRDWAHGSGFVTREIMAEHLPAPSPDSRVMICGPPGMVAAAKKSLVELGFEKPGAVSKADDQTFCF